MVKSTRTLTYQGDMLVHDTHDDVSMADGAYSWQFDGNTQSVSIPHSTQLALTTGDWTIEFWACPTVSDSIVRPILTKTASAATVAANFWIGVTGSTGKWSFYVSNNLGTAYTIADTTTVNADIGVWQHIVLSRFGNLITVHKNGIRLINSAFSTAIFEDSSAVMIAQYGVSPISGATSYGANRFRGLISNLRITKGVALYTGATVTIPSAPLVSQGTVTSLLTCQSNTIKDNSSYAAILTDGNAPTISYRNPFTTETSVLFSGGTTQQLSVPANAVFAFGTGDFTIEGWFYFLNNTSVRVLNNRNPAGAAAGTWSFAVGPSSASFTEVITGEPGPVNNSLSAIQNAWFHIAVVRVSGVTTIYRDGISVISAAQTTNFNSSSYALIIGRGSATGETTLTGYMSNIRILKGVGLYTANFVVPSAPLNSVGASLLTCTSGAQFKDYSPTGSTITPTGTPTVSYLNPFDTTLQDESSIPTATRLTNSVLFNGTTQYMSFSTTTGIGAFGTGDFTIEGWFYYTTNISIRAITNRNPSGAAAGVFSLNMSASAAALTEVNTGEPGVTFTFASSILNTWAHVAIVRISGVTYCYVNGVSVGSGQAQTTNFNSTNAVYIGKGPAAADTGYFPGYMSNIRIVKGIGVYTGTFTPSTTPLQTTQAARTGVVAITDPTYVSLLTCQTYGSFIDRSVNETIAFTYPTALSNTARDAITTSLNNPFNTTNQYPAITNNYYSNLFNGTSQYLTIPSNAAFSFGTGDFTIECWVYTPAASAGGVTTDRFIFGGFSSSSPSFAVFLENTANRPAIWNGTTQYTSPLTVATNTWTHVAWIRSSSTLYIYVNGVLGLTQPSYTTSFATAATWYIGKNDTASDRYFNGYISNLRVVKGTALYTAAFTPSTAPLTTVAGTQLLTCQSPIIVDNSTTPQVITNTGTVTVDRVNPFKPDVGVYYYGFNNSSTGYISAPASTNYNIGTSAFTIEAFVYFNATSATVQTVAGVWLAGKLSWLIQCTSTTIYFYTSGTGSNFLGGAIATISLAAGQWYHMAFTRTSGTTVSCYVNGDLAGTIVLANATIFAASQALYIGLNIDGTQQPLNGYISNFRMTVGTALYTNDFMPPMGQLTTTSQGATASQVKLLTCIRSSQFKDWSDYKATITVAAGASVNYAPAPALAFSGVTAYPLPTSATPPEFPVSKTTSGGSLMTSSYLDEYTNPNSKYAVSFNGSNQNLLLAGTTALDFLAFDFTIEAWVYVNPGFTSTQMIVNRGGGSSIAYASYELYVNSGNVYFAASTTNTGYEVGGEDATGIIGTYTTGTWFHAAVTRSGNTYRGFVNGVLGYTETVTDALLQVGTTRGLAIGGSYATTWGSGTPVAVLNGSISNLRIVKGTAVYTAAFTPPTAPLTPIYGTQLLTCQRPTIVDTSPNAYSITNTGTATISLSTISWPTMRREYTTGVTEIAGQLDDYTKTGAVSAFFYGSSSNLLAPSTSTNAALTFTGNFTVEGWFYPTVVSGSDHAIFCLGTETTNRYVWYITSAGQISSNLYGAGTVTYTVSTIGINTWNHIAVVRSGSTVSVYLNGVLSVTTDTQAGTIGNGVARVGSDSGGTANFAGYISNFRATGIAVYTGAFTTPTSPLRTTQVAGANTAAITSVSSVSLLTCQDLGLTDKSNNALVITNTSVTTTIKTTPF